MSVSVIKMTDLDLTGLKVLIREDLNVPLKNGKVTSDARIQAALPTIKHAMEAGARVMVMSHLGRPVEGEFDQAFSMQPVADHMATLLGCKVPLIKQWNNTKDTAPENGEVALLENVRFNQGEKKDDEQLSRVYASLCDVFVMDAFGTAHRAQASTHGVAKYAKIACAGPLLVGELDALSVALSAPVRPMVAIVGGAKVSTKLTVLESLSGIVDQLIVGGGIANTFLAASGVNVGKSLCEHALVDDAKKLMNSTNIPLPTDVITGKEFSENTPASLKPVGNIDDDDMIFDVGPESSAHITAMLKNAKTILWNGPVGVFEFDQFGQGTQKLSQAIASSDAYSLAGGGDTLAAIDKYGIKDKVSYISTGGGAFLEYVEGKVLPAVAILEQRAQQKD